MKIVDISINNFLARYSSLNIADKAKILDGIVADVRTWTKASKGTPLILLLSDGFIPMDRVEYVPTGSELLRYFNCRKEVKP